ncbi:MULTISPECIES: hypothetical protein [Butyricimonas]|uniref:hypothetical protein n=1 Tax=Butyricimonas TaxID=574697 RepID=UPI0016526EC9|nr:MULTISPECIES: hypothetical protein [Butyricimonas]
MGFLSKIFGGGSNDSEKKETSADKMLKVIRERTTTDYARVIPVEEKTMPWNSKIGGLPYMPRGFEYPYDETQPAATPESAAAGCAARGFRTTVGGKPGSGYRQRLPARCPGSRGGSRSAGEETVALPRPVEFCRDARPRGFSPRRHIAILRQWR